MAEKVEQIANATSFTSYSTAGGSILVGGLTANDLLAISGIVLGLLTFIVNWVYKHKSHKLEKARFERESGG